MTKGYAADENGPACALAPLSPGNAVGAIIVIDNEKYLLQLRDQKPDIFFPNYWCLFGGAMDPGEDETSALARELKEEIGLIGMSGLQLMRFDFNLEPMLRFGFFRSYYEIKLPAAAIDRLVLREGEAMRAFTAQEVLELPRVAPYDAFALWLHISRYRLQL